jgi:hypothetical protein
MAISGVAKSIVYRETIDGQSIAIFCEIVRGEGEVMRTESVKCSRFPQKFLADDRTSDGEARVIQQLGAGSVALSY